MRADREGENELKAVESNNNKHSKNKIEFIIIVIS